MTDLTLVGDKELLNILKNLDYRTQQKYNKRVLRDVAQKVLVKPLRAAASNNFMVRTGNLKQSMGYVSGRSKKSAVVFAGPRMGGKYKGYVANILEHGKGERRVPTKAKVLKTPYGFKKSVAGIKARPFVRPTLEDNLGNTEQHIYKSIRTVFQRVINRYRK